MIDKKTLAESIILTAARFVGLKEIKPNQKWDNPATPGPDAEIVAELIGMMRSAPWEPGWAYCAAFCEGVVVKALQLSGATDMQCQKFAAKFTPHCVTSANNFSRLGLLTQRPAEGAIWLARHGSTSNGHAGLVTDHNAERMETAEANTSNTEASGAKEREGDWITTKSGPVAGRGTLRTLGFITPADIISLIS